MLGGQPRTVAARAGAPEREAEVGLVAAIARGERAALGALYDLHAPIVMGLAKRMLRDQAAAEDLVHDVFLEVWQHAAEFDAARGSVRAWLVVRARSRALDRLGRAARDARATGRLGLDVEGAATTPGAQAAVDGARVRGHLAALPADLRAVLDLAYFEGLSATESAERLGVPAGTVKSRLARALEQLRRALDGPREGDA
ncbi:MAG TPA: sigma-70 family RNA polymerase sigma factor [Polyangia bacterium]|nr:sigma-70 family RNA polymerase sigma factor [Polyangia bacterium]